VINWDGRSHRTPDDEVAGPEVLAVPLGVPQDGEGGVGGGVYPPQLLQGLAVLLQPLSRGLEAVREGKGGEGGGRGQLGLQGERRRGGEGEGGEKREEGRGGGRGERGRKERGEEKI